MTRRARKERNLQNTTSKTNKRLHPTAKPGKHRTSEAHPMLLGMQISARHITRLFCLSLSLVPAWRIFDLLIPTMPLRLLKLGGTVQQPTCRIYVFRQPFPYLFNNALFGFCSRDMVFPRKHCSLLNRFPPLRRKAIPPSCPPHPRPLTPHPRPLTPQHAISKRSYSSMRPNILPNGRSISPPAHPLRCLFFQLVSDWVDGWEIVLLSRS